MNEDIEGYLQKAQDCKLPLYLNEILTEAFALRQGSDYELQFDITKEKAQELFENAIKFVTTITDYIKDQFAE